MINFYFSKWINKSVSFREIRGLKSSLEKSLIFGIITRYGENGRKTDAGDEAVPPF